ncbi:MAG: class I SAM-dependent methyltransferase [Planctomycetota bacterium]
MNRMNELDVQKTYWDNVAEKRTFTHPIQISRLQELVPVEGKILDYGCGYGRTCSELMRGGFTNIVGVDISSRMIARGKSLYPDLDLQYFDGASLPFPDDTFNACTMLAVLTCIPTDAGQKRVINELHRVLCPGGILYLSYYPIQQDARNLERYRQYENEFGVFGVFRLSDGGVVRHHSKSWIYELLSKFEIIKEDNIKVSTMMGNEARVSQILARKTITNLSSIEQLRT